MQNHPNLNQHLLLLCMQWGKMCRNDWYDLVDIKEKIKARFKATSIWPFNPKAMDNKIQPWKIYNAISINNHGSDQKEYTSNEETDHNQNQQWREESVTK
jgi:hypothetical protein